MSLSQGKISFLYEFNAIFQLSKFWGKMTKSEEFIELSEIYEFDAEEDM